MTNKDKKTKAEKDTLKLEALVVEAMSEKQGENIVSLELDKVSGSVAKRFVICHARSTVQVESIVDFIIHKAKTELNERLWHKEGSDSGTWVLLDYVDVVAHVFLDEYRNFYNLEGLWSDVPKNEY